MPPAMLSLLDKIGGPRRATILLVGLAAAVGVFGLARWASAPTWIPAFAGDADQEVRFLSGNNREVILGLGPRMTP